MAISHAIPANTDVENSYRTTTGTGYPRDLPMIRALLDGWELLPPGLVEPGKWSEDLNAQGTPGFETTDLASMGVCGLAVLREQQ